MVPYTPSCSSSMDRGNEDSARRMVRSAPRGMSQFRVGRSLTIDFAKLSVAMRRCVAAGPGASPGHASGPCVGEFRVCPQPAAARSERGGFTVRAPLSPIYLGRATGGSPGSDQNRGVSSSPSAGRGEGALKPDSRGAGPSRGWAAMRPYRPVTAPLAVARSGRAQGKGFGSRILLEGSVAPLWKRPLRWLLRRWG